MVVGEIIHERDTVIIGGGPGGYTAAIRAAQLGKEVTLIEEKLMGGACLNEGCIPSKVFAEAARQSLQFPHLTQLGFDVPAPSLDFSKLQSFKTKVIGQLRSGVEALCKANKIERIEGKAYLLSEDRIGVENGHQFDVYRFNQAVIATGSKAVPHFKGGKRIVNERTIYAMDELPVSILIQGGDYIALEIAYSFAALGSSVTCIISESDFSYLDSTVEKELRRQCKKKKIKLIKGEITAAEDQGNEAEVVVTASNGDVHKFSADYFYSASSYEGNIKELGIDRIGVKTDENHFIQIDNTCQTSVPNLYAIGDVTGGRQLAVKAIRQGKVAAEKLAGIPSEWDERYLPTVIHTQPPLAYVGVTEEEARNLNLNIAIGQFSLAGNGYASLKEQKDGFAKIIKEKDTDRILGVHIIGDGAAELISTGVLALEMVARDEDLLFPLYPHPSINEAILEAAEAIKGQAIHQPPAKTPSFVK